MSNRSPGRLDQRREGKADPVGVDGVDQVFEGVLALGETGSGNGQEPGREEFPLL